MTTQRLESRYKTPTSFIVLNFSVKTYEPVPSVKNTTARSLPSVATPALVCEKHWKWTGISFTETNFFFTINKRTDEVKEANATQEPTKG